MGVLNVQVMISLNDTFGDIDTWVQAIRECNIIGANRYTNNQNRKYIWDECWLVNMVGYTAWFNNVMTITGSEYNTQSPATIYVLLYS